MEDKCVAGSFNSFEIAKKACVYVVSIHFLCISFMWEKVVIEKIDDDQFSCLLTTTLFLLHKQRFFCILELVSHIWNDRAAHRAQVQAHLKNVNKLQWIQSNRKHFKRLDSEK